METATFAGGCFWCTEAIFEGLKGVSKVTSGYAGGHAGAPNYESVSSGNTGHAEAIQIEFDSNIISYKDLLYVFLKTHDPTTPNQQGADVGSQYRSVIFYANKEQAELAHEAVKDIQLNLTSPVVTEILPLDKFYEAEDYHQDFYRNNPDKNYCKLVIDPKIQKLKKDFKEYLK